MRGDEPVAVHDRYLRSGTRALLSPAMQITGSNTYPPVSIALPSRNLLPVVLRPRIAKQERQQLRRPGPDPSDHGCTLRSTHKCPASQRDDQATAFPGTHHPWQVCQQLLDSDPVDCCLHVAPR